MHMYMAECSMVLFIKQCIYGCAGCEDFDAESVRMFCVEYRCIDVCGERLVDADFVFFSGERIGSSSVLAFTDLFTEFPEDVCAKFVSHISCTISFICAGPGVCGDMSGDIHYFLACSNRIWESYSTSLRIGILREIPRRWSPGVSCCSHFSDCVFLSTQLVFSDLILTV